MSFQFVYRSALLFVVAAMTACTPSHRMMPPPNVYASHVEPLFEELPPAHETSIIDVLYVTDRAPEHDGVGGLRYGHERSRSAALGSVKVEIGKGLSWDEVLRHSVDGSPPLRRPKLRVRSIEEHVRFPETPYELRVVAPGKLGLSSSASAEQETAFAAAHELLSERLRATPRKEVFLFIHGVNTSFETAAIQMAEGWHFLGREGVPLLYTWPARSGSALSYAADRESGEFTILHLKHTLEVLGSTPGLEKIHVVAHSRGTDIASTALREFALEARGADWSPRDRFKIENLVLVAADLDFDVVMQRMIAEGLRTTVGRLTVYGYSKDRAMLAANVLLKSQLRVGEISSEELTEQEREMLEQLTGLDIVSYDGRIGGFFGHFYFLENPAISSDVVALLRFGDPPGKGLRRGLRRVEPRSNFWTVEDDYLLEAAAEAGKR